MGRAKGIEMGFYFESLISKFDGLEVLSKLFSEDEVEEVIKHMPIDRAPGLDGFTGLFLKKCWPIICKDFYT